MRRAGSAATRRRRVKRGEDRYLRRSKIKATAAYPAPKKASAASPPPRFAPSLREGARCCPRKSSSYPIQVPPHLLLQFVERIKPQTVIKVLLIIVMNSLNLAVVPWRQRPQKRMSDAVSAAKKS